MAPFADVARTPTEPSTSEQCTTRFGMEVEQQMTRDVSRAGDCCVFLRAFFHYWQCAPLCWGRLPTRDSDKSFCTACGLVLIQWYQHPCSVCCLCTCSTAVNPGRLAHSIRKIYTLLQEDTPANDALLKKDAGDETAADESGEREGCGGQTTLLPSGNASNTEDGDLEVTNTFFLCTSHINFEYIRLWSFWGGSIWCQKYRTTVVWLSLVDGRHRFHTRPVCC